MKCCTFFNWLCNLLKPVSENDFNRGYATGVCVVLAVVVLMLIIKIILKIIFRRRRCSEMISPAVDGNVSVSVSALEDTVRKELSRFHSVKISKIKLYRIRKKYILNLICEYDGRDGGLPQITRKIKDSVSTMANDFFGISSIREINLKFERLSKDAVPAEKDTPAVAENEEIKSFAPTPVAPVENSGNDSADDIF